MAEQLETSEFDGKTVLVFRSGKWNGSPYTTEDVKTIFDNTIKNAVDLPFRPHMGFFSVDSDEAEGWVGYKSLAMPTQNKVVGELSNVTEEMAEKLRKKKFRYVSPELAYPNWKAMDEHDVREVFIVALAPVTTPAIRPQKPLTALEDGSCREMLMDDSWSEALMQSGEETVELQSGKFSMEWAGTGEAIAKTLTQTTKESTMADESKDTKDLEKKDETETSDSGEKKESKDESTTTTSSTTDTATMLSAKTAELDKKLAQLSRKKIREFTDLKLAATGRLHVSQKEDYVARTVALDLNDSDEDDKGKTALDRHLDAEFNTRAAAVDFTETAVVPDPDGKGPHAPVETLDLNDLEVARLEEAKKASGGKGYTDKENELDNLACQIQRELKCEFDVAMNLAYKKIAEKEGV